MSALSRVETWLYGLFAAFLGGGASAFTASVTAGIIAPDKFNAHEGLKNFLELAGTTFLVNGLISIALYLKQSPLPKLSDGQTEMLTKSDVATKT